MPSPNESSLTITLPPGASSELALPFWLLQHRGFSPVHDLGKVEQTFHVEFLGTSMNEALKMTKAPGTHHSPDKVAQLLAVHYTIGHSNRSSGMSSKLCDLGCFMQMDAGSVGTGDQLCIQIV